MLLGDLKGTQEVPLAIGTKGVLSARPSPTAATINAFYEATDNGTLYRNTGTIWEPIKSRPTAGSFSSRPAAGAEGRLYEASDQGVLYRDNGSSWETLIAAAKSGLLSALPAPGVAGREYEATDVKVLYRDTGAAWQVIPFTIQKGLQSARPTAAVEGRFYEATDTGVLWRDSGTQWYAIALGGVTALSGALGARPASAAPGRFYEATDVQVLYRDTGSGWQALPLPLPSDTYAKRPAAAQHGRIFRSTDFGLYRDTGAAWEQLMRAQDMGGIWAIGQSVNDGYETITNTAYAAAPISEDKVILTAQRPLTVAALALSFRGIMRKVTGTNEAFPQVALYVNGVAALAITGKDPEIMGGQGLLAGHPPTGVELFWSDSTFISQIGGYLISGADPEDRSATRAQSMGGTLVVPVPGGMAQGDTVTVELRYKKFGVALLEIAQRRMMVMLVGA